MDYYYPPSLQGAIDALGSVYRALRAWKFYPKGHPTRYRSIKEAHTSLQAVLCGNNLTLVCGRTGFSFPDGEKFRDTTRLSVALSTELFVRRVQKLTILHDMYPEDLLDFLKIVALTPEQIHKAGGMEQIMEEHGIRSLWVNEFDLSVIGMKRRKVEDRGVRPQSLAEIEASEHHPAEAEADAADLPPQADVDHERELNVLIARLATTTDEASYLILSRQAVDCVDQLLQQRNLPPLYPLAELLAAQILEDGRADTLKEYAGLVLEQLNAGNAFLLHAFGRMEAGEGLSREALPILLRNGGDSAVLLAIEQMAVTGNLAVRKALSTSVAKVGEAALPALYSLLGDKRWFIIRNMAAILGIIGSRDAVPTLISCLGHKDERVCKEAMRSLSLIGGNEAEEAILTILRSGNNALMPQAIASLGGMKSRKALPDLLRLVLADDLFLKTLSLKQEALAAIGMIGITQVTPYLLDLLESRRLVATNRWREFRIAIVHCLERLGDKRSLPLLRRLAVGSGELETACTNAVEGIERAGRELHGKR